MQLFCGGSQSCGELMATPTCLSCVVGCLSVGDETDFKERKILISVFTSMGRKIIKHWKFTTVISNNLVNMLLNLGLLLNNQVL